MKARTVAGLEPDGALGDNLRRIVAVRLHELESFAPLALDPEQRGAQHDMRIAAKRLRYVLDLARPVLGDAARQGARQARRLQDLLGELRDHDELLALLRDAGDAPRVTAHVNRRRARLFERFVAEWLERDLSAIERSPSAPEDGAAA